MCLFLYTNTQRCPRTCVCLYIHTHIDCEYSSPKLTSIDPSFTSTSFTIGANFSPSQPLISWKTWIMSSFRNSSYEGRKVTSFSSFMMNFESNPSISKSKCFNFEVSSLDVSSRNFSFGTCLSLSSSWTFLVAPCFTYFCLQTLLPLLKGDSFAQQPMFLHLKQTNKEDSYSRVFF